MKSVRCLTSLRQFFNHTETKLGQLTTSSCTTTTQSETVRKYSKGDKVLEPPRCVKISIEDDLFPKPSKNASDGRDGTILAKGTKVAGSTDSSSNESDEKKKIPTGQEGTVMTKEGATISNCQVAGSTDSKSSCPEGKNFDLPASVFKPKPQPKILGPGASRTGKYKVPEYYCYNPFSYFEMEVVMASVRTPQPSAIAKKTPELEGGSENTAEGGDKTIDLSPAK